MSAALPTRDATFAVVLLIAAIGIGSGGFATIDPALLGYLGATLVGAFGVVWRVSAFWRRPASAFYARALFDSLFDLRRLRRTMTHAASDLAVQDFIRRRSYGRWTAHLLLSLGTLAAFAITLPLVFGWMHFTAAGERGYRMIVLTLPAFRFEVDGALAWLIFHGLSLAGIAVGLGAIFFLGARLRARGRPGATAAFAVAPLVLLLAVALTGLALPATRDSATAFRWASWLHEASVVLLLVSLPFSKLGHVLTRPLQLGARAVRASAEPRASCSTCGVPLAPVAQQRAVAALLAARGAELAAHLALCQGCRRRALAAAQANLVGAAFQPRLIAENPPGGFAQRQAERTRSREGEA